MRLAARAVVDGVALGLAVSLAAWAFIVSPTFVALLVLSAVLAGIDLYVVVKGWQDLAKWIDVALIALDVITIFVAAFLLYTFASALPYTLNLAGVGILVESVALLWVGMANLRDAATVLLGRPLRSLRYVGPAEVRRYVREVREEG